jgi:inner membrane protein
MATIYTHAFAGAGIASLLTPRPKPLLYWSLAALLPVLPDFDTFWIAPYGSVFGHRGFTHSLLFALCAGLVTAAAGFRRFHMRFWAAFALFTLVTASHGVLDAFTNGGYGIPFLWPISQQRWGPYGPIKVSDIALEFPDPRKSRALQTELLYVWLPLGTAVLGVQFYRWHRARGDAGKSGMSG